ncbi:MAG TPA: HD-GYP domain-containing protein [Chloroflexia bacterium]|nr:HD-GYP domain-containing protein [Chloroflexia bacterium]
MDTVEAPTRPWAESLRRLWPQPFVAVAVSTLAATALTGAWGTLGLDNIEVKDVLLGLALIGVMVATYHFPFHLGRSQKIDMTSIPLYLAAALIPSPPLAASVVGVGILISEMSVRSERRNLYSDVVTATGRWIIVALAGATFGGILGWGTGFSLVIVALILWAGDSLTFPLVVAPMCGERPFRLMISNTRDSARAEGSQYLLGLLGALAASVEIWALGLLALPLALVHLAFKSVNEMQSGTRLVLEGMADAVDLRDPYTGGHSRRVAESSAAILRQMGLSGPEADLVVAAARVHDIGKFGVPDSILNKPGRLTPEEEAIMRNHPVTGADLLMRYPDFKRGVEIVRHHHESWDGTGYPHGQKGTDIPFGARVIAVADSYDAMTSDRPYRQAMSVERATSILRQGRGTQWDPEIVDAFLLTVSSVEPASVEQVITLEPSLPIVASGSGGIYVAAS